MVQSVKFLLPKLDNLSLSHRPHGDELRLVIPALGSTGRQSLEPADQQTSLIWGGLQASRDHLSKVGGIFLSITHACTLTWSHKS